jgi:tetratricopeptide (TPR) repeat protein
MRRHLRKLVLLAALLAAGCGGAGAAATKSSVAVPERVTDADYADALRTLHRLPMDDPNRDAIRQRIVAFLDRRGSSLLELSDYDAVVAHFESISSLYSPEELGRGQVPRELAAPARFLREHGSRRGDEGHAMAALWVLRALHPDRAELDDEYRQVASWGRAARAHLDNPLDTYGGLIDVWEAHALLTPAPEVLNTLAKLHLERRDVVVGALRSGEGMSVGDVFGGVFGMAPHHVLRRAPFEVAAVYLRHGDIASAITQVAAMGHVSDIEAQLLRVLQDARAEGDEGGDAIVELAEAYRSARPDVAFGLCRDGLRRSPKDPRFPTCLARVAAGEERYADATAWYAQAIEVAPTQRGIYDEALQRLNEFIEKGLFDADPAGARILAAHAERILSERLRRWPGAAPPVAPERLDLLVGSLEMNAGNADEARTRLEKSLAAGETMEALLSLASLEQRLGRLERAAALYQRALEAAPERTPAEVLRRAEVRERLGDVLRAQGKEGQAEAMYHRAANLLDGVTPQLEGPPLSLVLVRRGTVLSRLGRAEEARESFRRAMRAAPHWRETYAGILSHLAVAEPDPRFAHETFRQARRQLTLDPEWKVYFALWVGLISGRAGQSSESDVREVLRDMSSGAAWWARLAKLGIGALPYDDLLGEASSVGERAEAHFYEGARRLVAGDRAGAERYFERVLETRMVSFYEYIMAQELLTGDAP